MVTRNTGGSGISFSSQPAAITAATIDATTDFTVGTTVITDDSIVMTPSTGDTVTIAAATNGVLNITTVDTAAAAGNIQITADGTAELAGTTVTLDSSGSIALDATTDVLIPNGTDLVIGHTASVSTGGVASAFQLNGTAQAQTYLSFNHFQAGAGGGTLTFMKSRDPAIADGTFAIVNDNDRIGQIRGFADDGADLDTETHRMNMLVEDATPAAGKVGSAWAWYTMQENTTTLGEKLRLNNTGSLLIGDTANANMTTGLSINQATTYDEIISLRASDVNHGMTTRTLDNTFGRLLMVANGNGGLFIEGFADTGTIGLEFQGNAISGDTGKDTGARGIIESWSAIKSGTGITAPGADSNIVVFHTNALARFIFDVEGSGHADVAWVTYDDHDDIALMQSFEDYATTRRLTPERYGDNPLAYNAEYFESVGIVGKNSWHRETREDGREQDRQMVNFTKLSMLHHGAILQTADRIGQLEEKLALAESKLAAIGA
jgi:hypothetical protein